MNQKELGRRAQALKERYPLDENSLRFSWDARRYSLREKMIAGEDVENFLRWSVCSEFLSTGHVPHITGELGDLMDGIDSLRWKRVLQVPEFGGAILDDTYHTTGTMIQQAYHLSLWENLAYRDVQSLDKIVEFGGGYGAMAYLCRKLGFSGEYVIIDLPEMSLLQKYYLENVDIYDVSCVQKYSGTDVDLYISLFALSEVPPDDRIMINAHSYLFGYQPEWNEVNNRKWFEEATRQLSWINWVDTINPHFSYHRVLVGV